MRLLFCAFVIILAFCVPASRCDNADTYYRGSFGGNADTETTERNSNSLLCMNITPQHTLNIEKLMGMWYGSEIIVHTQDVPGVFQYDHCVVIHLSDVTDQMQLNNRDYNYNNYRRTQYNSQQHQYNNDNGNENNNNNNNNREPPSKYLRLVWSEKDDKNVEYTFNYTEYSPGLWTNVGEQRGSLVALNQGYTQFTGTVQVVKAVNDHLVLTFCGNDIRGSIYTIVLSRKSIGLSSENLRSIRNLLSRRGLSTETVRKVCPSAATTLKTSIVFVVLLGVFAVLGKFVH